MMVVWIWAYSPGELIKKSEELLGIKVESSNKINLPEAGYFGLKNKNNLFLYDAGKIAPDTLPAHGHGDIFFPLNGPLTAREFL